MDFSSIIHFLTDSSRNISSKAIFIFFTFLLLLLLDNTFSFSYYYNTSQKVTQVKAIADGLKDSTLSELEKKELMKLRAQILNHMTFKDIGYNYLSNLNFESESVTQIADEPIDKVRNPTIHLLTSAWWILITLGILSIALPFVLLIERKDVLSTIFGFIIIGSLGYLVSLVLSKLFSYIPLIDGNPLYNYVLNFSISGLLLWVLILIGSKSNGENIPSS